jgi:hypothetical protein
MVFLSSWHDPCFYWPTLPPQSFFRSGVNYISTNRGGLRWGNASRVGRIINEMGLGRCVRGSEGKQWKREEDGRGAGPRPAHSTAILSPPVLFHLLYCSPHRRRNMGGCLYRVMMRPTPTLVRRFLAPALAVADPAVDVVGVHIRTGDAHMHGKEPLTLTNTTFTEDKYWACAAARAAALQAAYANASALASRAGATPRPVKYLFVTDSLAYKQAAEAHFGPDKLLTTDTVPIHIAKMQLM